jgi:hypothetical protein
MEEEEMVYCSICYMSHPASQTFSLSCNHRFGLVCLRSMFSINITEGRVIDLKCAQFDCNKQYTIENLRAIIENDALLAKYEYFKKNIEINSNP